MARKKRQGLSRGQQAVMAALWAAGDEATAGEVTKLLSAHGGDQAYRTVQTVLGVCKDKGWVKTRKKGRKLFYRPTLSERDGIAALFDDFAAQFLEGRPSENCEAVAKRLRNVTVSSASAANPLEHAAAWKDVGETLADHESQIHSVQHATTRLEIEVQGLRALVEELQPASGRRGQKRRRSA